ncbi:hypothetical protein [Oricola sp.]|uniref:hypothetical protein n=1 Tax=Oricola sp. TaxID=1979950 RepID=UPI0025DC46FD|nr:hypothetical protein [Oricola sp.]MCI5074628.1 hypothetical protein [Oricola sp.]
MDKTAETVHAEHSRQSWEHFKWRSEHMKALAILKRAEATLFAHEARILAHDAEILHHEEQMVHGSDPAIKPLNEEHARLAAQHESGVEHHAALINAVLELSKFIAQEGAE